MRKAAGTLTPLKRYHHVLIALGISNAVSLSLYLMRVIGTHSTRYNFLVGNLILAWIPVGLAFWLKKRLDHDRWATPANIGLTVAWLAFLPNSFYLVSDLVHLQPTGEVNILFDSVLFASFIFNGFISGLISLYMVHTELIKRVGQERAHQLIAGVILLCSFAIYLGRHLRWNSWDLIASPAGLIFDVSEPILNPVAHPQAFLTTLTFFMLIGSVYVVAWQLIMALRHE